MGDLKGFLKIKRKSSRHRPALKRVRDYREVYLPRSEKESYSQASRCMDCGTPFCHWGCPLGNYIPEWNDLVFRGEWEKAVLLLEAVTIFPEVTGRVCPAFCEYACVLEINDEAVTIRENELAIIEKAFQDGLIKPHPPKRRTGKKVAVVGSGPAGLACAVELNRRGHRVTVFERADKLGGLLRYGIPDFKLEKNILDRRLKIWKQEGINFRTGISAGEDYSSKKLLKEFDALCLAGGSRIPRDLPLPGRGLKGIHFALDYLIQSNKRVAGEKFSSEELIDAQGKKVIVIGGGDTGSDCVGTAHRQGAKSVVQIELLPQPPRECSQDYPWPLYPMILKTSTSHAEGGERFWSVVTKKFIGARGQVKQLSCRRLKFGKKDKAGRLRMHELPKSNFTLEADLVLLALGFLHPESKGLLTSLGIKLSSRGNVATNAAYLTSRRKVFAAGDTRRGQSLVVWALFEGKAAAESMHQYLSNK